MRNKLFTIVIIFISLFLICTTSFAATVSASKTTMEVVDRSVCEIKIKDLGDFTKELTKFDSNKKEVTLTLTIKNTAKSIKVTKPVELFLVLDNSKSMTETYENKIKNQYVIEAAKQLTNSLFEYFENIKIGVVGFSSELYTNTYREGTLNDATLLLGLSDSKESVNSSISGYSKNGGPRTNIEAGLSIAESNFSNSTESEKYIILISDGVPNLSLDTAHTMTYSGVNATNTRNKLKSLASKGYNIFSVLMGSDNSNIENPSAPVIESTGKHMTYGELATEIFGTVSNPTVGKFYYIDYENLYKTINEDIYKNIAVSRDVSLKNIVIKDYFPREILENFNFEYDKSPNIGSVSAEVDPSDNSIVWKIDLLPEGEVATLSYNLTLKDEYNEEIVKKILPTNEKVDIDYESEEGKDKSSSDVSPAIRLLIEDTPTPTPEPKPDPKPEPTPEPEPEPPKDNTIAEDPIPQTGIYSVLFTVSTFLVGSIIFNILRFNRLKKKKEIDK